MLRLTLTACIFVGAISLGQAVETSFPIIIQKANYAVSTYQNKLEKVIPFKEVRGTLATLDRMAKDYNGRCSQGIRDASSMGYRAGDNYFFATKEILQWALSGKYLLEKYISEDKLEERFNVVKEFILKGVETLKKSLVLLEESRDLLTSMQDKLRPIPRDLKNELNDLRRNHDDKLREFQKSIDTAANAVLSIAGGPFGALLGLFGNLVGAGIPASVVIGERIASENEKMRITQVFYDSLTDSVKRAIFDLVDMKETLHKEITGVQGLAGEVIASKYLVEEVNDVNAALRTLQGTLNNFVQDHQYLINPTNSKDLPFLLRIESNTMPRFRDIKHRHLDFNQINDATKTFLNLNEKEQKERFWNLDTTEHTNSSDFKNIFNSYMLTAL